jgi:SpoVK/Ycf46/Vps4 family AAA+-type ATPase
MYTIRIIEHKGLKFGYIHSSRNRAASGVYVETEKLGEAREEIKKLLWDTYKDASLIMRCNRKIVLADNETRIVFEPDNVFESMASKRAEDYSRYMQKCLDAGVPRSVMFYGPPGTGKSTIARTIIDMLNLRSFRIRVEDVGNIETSTIFEAIEIFQPDAIILDDFDRSHTQASLLETLEFFKYRVKLVIATVNNRNLLDEAILRPGRFDELIEVKQMDEEVVKKILGETMADAFEVVKDWPIAFVQEYTKRRMFMTPEEAEDSTRELAQRVKRLEKYDDDEPNISGIYKTLKKSKKP